ncbi:PREDICTED: embryonic polarity protein dorsal isoform X2 [Rhagoletis zephyria]|uniref:embryonic polarity protein dorsal isoform X2 n=1 Tax=Rhagoletis zephyria TaxID=28612 RepID=UPI0008114DD8|nr:PREDICTED: embryonic polarity protein dorsal isoform X2 [Rhagoletis zephyria]
MYTNQGNALMGGGQNVSPNGEQLHQQSPQHHQQQNLNYNGAQPKQSQADLQSSSQQQATPNKKIAKKAYVKIVEQPASKALRFRYECEGRSAGSIPGVNSTPEMKTFPTIEIVGYKGRAVVVVSCVTKDAPYRPHPHNLVGKEGCKKGVCTLEINSETMRAVFSNLGIQCVKKKDIESALKAREDIRVDPFKTGFSHRFQPTSIDLNAVRLCFQVFLKGDMGRFTVPLPPVVSEPIYDKKAMSDLVISRICSCSATVLGNTKIILLCEKVAKEDIAVRFFEEKDGVTIWQAFGEFEHNDVHKQTAITFRTPKFHRTNITEPVEVFVQLQRPSDGAVSDPVKFEYVPAESGPEELRRKRQRTDGDLMHSSLQQQQKKIQSDHPGGRLANWNTPNIPAIKTEPREASPQHLYRAPSEMTPSPQPLSPSNNYNLPNTPSPYNMAMGGNTPLMSPNHQYLGGAGGGGGVPANADPSPTPLEVHNEYNAYGGGQQQQQHAQQQPHLARHYVRQHQMPSQHESPHQQPHLHLQHQQQQQQQQHQQHHQQFHGMLYANNDVGNWEEKFANVLANVSHTTAAAMNNLNSNNNNQFNMQGFMAATAAGVTGVTQHAQWNFPPNHVEAQQLQQQQQQHHHQQQLQAQQQQQQPNNDATMADVIRGGTGGDVNNANIDEGGAEQGPTISTLLNFDSEQLVHINSEEQQMLRLTSDELRLSNLSISS